MGLIVTRQTAGNAQGNGKDTISIADGLITIRILRTTRCGAKIMIEAPRDIDITFGEFLNGNSINNDSTLTVGSQG